MHYLLNIKSQIYTICVSEIHSVKVLQRINRKCSERKIGAKDIISIKLIKGGKEKYANGDMFWGISNQISLGLMLHILIL